MQVIDLGAWTPYLEQELRAPYFAALLQRVGAARAAGTVYPPEERTFFALTATPPERVRPSSSGRTPITSRGRPWALRSPSRRVSACRRRCAIFSRSCTRTSACRSRPAAT